MLVYMAVTADKYSLPVACEDRLVDLARDLGLKIKTAESVYASKSKTREKHLGEYIRIIKVDTYLEEE